MLDSRVLPHSVTSHDREPRPKNPKSRQKRAALFHVHAGVETSPGPGLPSHD